MKKNNQSKTSHSKRRTPSVVRRVHRRLGIASALVVIFLSISGIALNHVSFFYSPQSYIRSQWILDWYGIKEPSRVYAYQFDSSLSELDQIPSDIIWADGMVLFKQLPVLFNEHNIIGMESINDVIYLLTQNSVHLFTQAGQKIESMKVDSLNGLLFEDVFSTNSGPEIVAWQVEQSIQFFNLDEMEFITDEGALADLEVGSSLNNSLPAAEIDAHLAREFILLKSKVLLDFHSGRLFGSLGPVIMDLFAIIFFILALSGLYLGIKRQYLK